VARAVAVDLDDPRIRVYRDLKQSQEARRRGWFVLEGEKLLDRLLASEQFPIASALVTERHVERVAEKLPEEVPLYVVTEEQIRQVAGYAFHLGVLACGVRRPWPSPRVLAQHALAKSGRLTIVVCPAVHNPENLGAIVRLADVFGVDMVLAGRECPDPLSRRVLRVSMGTVMRVPVIVDPELERTVAELERDQAVVPVATVTDQTAERLNQFKRPDRMALVLGNEAHGLTDAWIGRCSRRLTIPMRTGAESLNVAVAAGIMLHMLMCEPDSPPRRPLQAADEP
jgi:tRNA G18 (ribose-2'-O)-methylase SpoU